MTVVIFILHNISKNVHANDQTFRWFFLDEINNKVYTHKSFVVTNGLT